MYCYGITLLLKWQQNCGAIILYVYCVQHWLCASYSYSPASNPLWGGVLFLCKRVATFPFVGIRITHLNTWPFDRTRDGLTSKYSTHVRRARLSKLSHCNDCIWAIYDWNYGGLTIRKRMPGIRCNTVTGIQSLQCLNWSIDHNVSNFCLNCESVVQTTWTKIVLKIASPRLKISPKCVCGPDPTGRAYSAPQTP